MRPEITEGQLRSQLTRIALDIRPKNIINGSPDEPELVHEYGYNDDGVYSSRIKIYLRSNGCVSATCTMCPMPHETSYGNDALITSDNYLRQFDYAFKNRTIDDYDIVCVYNSGNWFVDREISPEARRGIYSTVAKSKSKAMMVQSLPQFITPKAIDEAKIILGDKKLIVGIGLQSATDVVRNLCVNTTCTKPQFERATELLVENGYVPETYLMIKPPFLTESEAIQDTVDSVKYLDSLGLTNASICPTRISPHTVAFELAKRDLYEPPSLWTVVDILKVLRQEGVRIRVACLDIDGKDDNTMYPNGCETCSPKILDVLRRYNISGDASTLDTLSCDKCEAQHNTRLEEHYDSPFEERVNNFIQTYTEELSL